MRGDLPPFSHKSADVDDYGKAVMGRGGTDCNKYPKHCRKECEDNKTILRNNKNASLNVTLHSLDHVTRFIDHVMLYLFDNTFSLYFKATDVVSARRMSLRNFSDASLRCKLLVLVGTSYIDELAVYVPSLSSENVDNIIRVYHYFLTSTVDKKDHKFVHFEGTTGDQVLLLPNNTFVWMDENANVVTRTNDDNKFPIENFQIERIFVSGGDIDLCRKKEVCRTVQIDGTFSDPYRPEFL